MHHQYVGASPIRAVRLCDTQLWLPDSAAFHFGVPYLIFLRLEGAYSIARFVYSRVYLFVFMLRAGTKTNSRSSCNRPMGRRRT